MASPFDLVSLASLKNWLDISSTNDDVLLAQLITQISRAILNVIDRPAIVPQPYSDTYDGNDEVSILLRQWPVNSITSCTVNGVTIPCSPPIIGSASALTGYVLDPASAAPPGAMQRLSLRGCVFTCGVQNVTIGYSAGYQITAETATIPAAAPYSVTAQAPYGGWASDVSVVYANGPPLTSVTASPAMGQYTVQNGVYSFGQADAGTTILLSYGYVPAELAGCCMDWAAERYAYRSRIGQRSKSLGGQETSSFIVKDIPDFVASALAPYRRVVMP
jgi:hypothetical protein